jgi:hypothetical protein
VHRTEVPQLSASRSLAAAGTLDQLGGHDSAADTLRIHASLVQQGVREERVAARFIRDFPEVPTAEVPAQPADVHDIDGLRVIGAVLSPQ